MIKGKTNNGFEFKADERILKDWRFVDAISETESSNPMVQFRAAKQVVKLLLHEEGYDSLISFIEKNNEGYVPQDEVATMAKEIINALREKIEESKKSSPSPE